MIVKAVKFRLMNFCCTFFTLLDGSPNHQEPVHINWVLEDSSFLPLRIWTIEIDDSAEFRVMDFCCIFSGLLDGSQNNWDCIPMNIVLEHHSFLPSRIQTTVIFWLIEFRLMDFCCTFKLWVVGMSTEHMWKWLHSEAHWPMGSGNPRGDWLYALHYFI